MSKRKPLNIVFPLYLGGCFYQNYEHKSSKVVIDRNIFYCKISFTWQLSRMCAFWNATEGPSYSAHIVECQNLFQSYNQNTTTTELTTACLLFSLHCVILQRLSACGLCIYHLKEIEIRPANPILQIDVTVNKQKKIF